MTQKIKLASELVAALQAAIQEHGDLPIYLDDPDTGCATPLALDPTIGTLWEYTNPDVLPCMALSAC